MSKFDLPVYLAAIRECYQNSLWHTAKSLLGYKDLTEPTHLRIIQALEAPTKRKLICIPRGTFKSSIVSVAYPIWRLIRNPNERILLDSEVYTNSKNFLREIVQHLESPHFIELFGYWKTDVWNQGEIVIKPRTKILKEASITAGGVGTTKVGQHFDLILGDDYNSPANSATPEGRQKVIDHYQYNRSILEVHGEYCIVGTRYSEDDLIGHIIRNELGLENETKFGSLKKYSGVHYF